jgi:hypothetical protein
MLLGIAIGVAATLLAIGISKLYRRYKDALET